MPTAVWLLILLLLPIINLAIDGVIVWIAGRIVRGNHVRYMRCLGVSLIWALPLLVLGLIIPEPKLGVMVPTGVLMILGVALGTMLVSTMIFKLVIGTSWPRAIAGLLIGIALWLPVQFGFRQAMRSMFMPLVVTTGSMEPTLPIGTHVFVDKLISAQRWDIVAFSTPDRSFVYVKRLIALPGETVELRDGEIFVDGTIQTKPSAVGAIRYLSLSGRNGESRGNTGTPFTVPKDTYYVLGDNSERSMDSRNWDLHWPSSSVAGVVPKSAVVGVARIVYWPIERARSLPQN